MDETVWYYHSVLKCFEWQLQKPFWEKAIKQMITNTTGMSIIRLELVSWLTINKKIRYRRDHMHSEFVLLTVWTDPKLEMPKGNGIPVRMGIPWGRNKIKLIMRMKREGTQLGMGMGPIPSGQL